MTREEAQNRVFGSAFSLDAGISDPKTLESYYEERRSQIYNGSAVVWMARMLSDDSNGAAADLYFRGLPVVIIDHDFTTGLTDAYEHPVEGVTEGSVICDQLPFEETVLRAEQFLQLIIERLTRTGQGVNN